MLWNSNYYQVSQQAAFVAEVVQMVSRGLGITYQPQNSGKVKHMNQRLKMQLSTLSRDSLTLGLAITNSTVKE